MASVVLSIVSMCLSHKRRGSRALALSCGFTFRRYGPHFRHNSLNSILAGSTYLAAYNRPLLRGILLMGYNGGGTVQRGFASRGSGVRIQSAQPFSRYAITPQQSCGGGYSDIHVLHLEG
jgi:hypothetical protein